MSQQTNTSITWAFFGTSHFSTIILDQLKSYGYVPSLIVTTEDKPKGRKLIMTPPEVKVWAQEHNVPYIQPKSLKSEETQQTIASCVHGGFDVFIVASYGKILPQAVLDMPRYKTLNVHPSLLPKLRGASPIQSAILTENTTGVTIMRLDAEMDHGPIVAQKEISFSEWPPYAEEAEKVLGDAGGKLIAETLPGWISGNISEQDQNHSAATYCAKIEKSDGLLNLNDPAEINLRKIRAYHMWPGAYFMQKKNENEIRVIVKRAHIENDTLIIERVVPEGKKEMDYGDFLRGLSNVRS